ncbi:hypothetical protein B0A52_05879 [Exophiala mesophila]|uniref:MARVEL domain-containing protein n=1 Tax=Exophiala mesophila TaxID=212818 RepID=A0A438N3X7_EXOME|nr:hypothetical protein B0A52_05879 [Exophiala mesophila]
MIDINPVLVVRVFQGILAFIAMATGATIANEFNIIRPDVDVPPAVIFFIFTSVFTLLLSVPYTIIAPRYFPIAAHPYAMLSAESITSILWLSGFAVIADLLRKGAIVSGGRPAARGSVVVGVFEFILYTGTAFFAFSHIFLEGRYAGNRRKNNNSISKPQMHRSWTGAEVV